MGAQLDKMSALQGALGEKDTVVGYYSDRVSPNAGEATDQGFSVILFELMESAAVYYPSYDFADIVLPTGVPPLTVFRSAMVRSSGNAGTGAAPRKKFNCGAPLYT